MNKSISLDHLLRNHDISAQIFFQNQGISQQIRNNLSKFIKYCRTHRIFTHQMITLALNIPYVNLENIGIKTASHAITQVLSNEQSAIAQLFFNQEQQKNIENSDIPQQLDGIRSEAQRLFKFDDDQQNQAQQQRPIELQKYQIVTLSLQILHQPQKNNTCLGHLQKIFSFLIRHNPLSVLQYFQSNEGSLKLLLNNLRYSSVSSMLAQLLTSQDKTRKYRYEQFKKGIILYIIEQIFLRIQDDDFFDGVMILIQQILNTTKQSYYEYFEDFKRISNLLVNENLMNKFYNIIIKNQQKSFRNICKYLQFLFIRINSEKQDNNYYHRGENKQSTMNFQIQIFLKNIPILIENILSIQNYSNLTKISYLSFLQALLITAHSKNISFTINQPGFICLLDCLNHQQKAGIFKNKLYNLILGIIDRSNEIEIQKFLQNHKIWDDYFTCVKSANYSNTKIYNKNESSAYDVSLINVLSKKNKNVILLASKMIGKDFKRICKKYETKIASFQNNNIQIKQQDNIQDLQIQKDNIPIIPFNFVVKNISIPILHIPDRNHLEQQSKQRVSQRIQSLRINGIRQVIEVEEVVSLTDQIKMFTINDREILSKDQNQIIKTQDNLGNSSEKNKQIKIEITNGIDKQKSKTGYSVDQARFFSKYLKIFA